MSEEPLSQDFGPFDGRVWLDCAHQGPLPGVAQEAAQRALAEKRSPHRIADDAFWRLPDRLRRVIAGMIGASVEHVVLGNSTTYGLNLLVQGLPLQPGDEVLLVDGDFPATVTTWLPLRERGVKLNLLRPSGGAPTADEVAGAITSRTRVFCSSWEFSFSGHAIDLEKVGEVCRSAGVRFVVNGSQGVGARPLSITEAPLDALVSCGFKWLCGPYGTGFAWMHPDLLTSLQYRQGYWLAHTSPSDLEVGARYSLRDDLGAAALDIFCPANFLNFMPWLSSLELISQIGVERIADHDQALVDRLLDGLPEDYEVLSPRAGQARSTLVIISHRESERNEDLYQALDRGGVDCAFRSGHIRFSPHLYNDGTDIDRALEVLSAPG